MEIKNNNIVELEVIINNRFYKFSMPMGAPLGEAYDASVNIINTIVKVIQENMKNQNDKTQEDLKK